MKDADRIAHAKAEQARAAHAHREAVAAADEQARRARAVAEAQAAIPQVLARLEAAGCPGVREVEVWDKRRLGKLRPTMKGAWVICHVQSLHYGEVASFPVHLLSDGRLHHYGAAKKPEDIVVPDHDRMRNRDSHVADLFTIATALRRLASGEAPLPRD